MTELKIYLDKDIDLDLIKSKKIAIIGFGSQGYGQGMNLVDTGCNVVFGLRKNGQSWIKAKDYGLNVIAMFDNDTSKIGTMINGKEVFGLTKVANLSARLGVDIAILTVPKECAETTANYLAGAGIKYIWNFTPCILDVPEHVKVWNENLVGSFLQFINSDEV